MDKLAEVLGQLAQQLGMSVNLLWPKVVQATYYQSLIWLILDPLILVVCLIVVAIGIPRFFRFLGKLDDEDAVFLSCVGAAFSLAFLVIIILITAGSIPGVLVGVLDPEGVTILRLLGK